MTKLMETPCELCNSPGGMVLWRDAFCRVVLVEDAEYPGFCRVILEKHVKEMTDLAPAQRTLLANAVWAVEAAQREVMQPEKVNLATLGNIGQIAEVTATKADRPKIARVIYNRLALGMPLEINDLDRENLDYFAYCAKHDFRLQRCVACKLLRYPPTAACPWCSELKAEWVPVEYQRVESQLWDLQSLQVEIAVEHSLSGEHMGALSFSDCRGSETPKCTDSNPKFERLLPEFHCRADRR